VAEAVEGFVAESTIMQLAFNRMALAAASEASVLITGESGTGKELAARAIHTFSPRADGPFVPVNLAALTPTLAESELFGHVKGAFTGADAARTGWLVQADGGTLFLDEVADIPLAIQIKLLRALETHEVVPVGGNQPIQTRFRVIAATHRNLKRLMAESQFRHDLYFRLGAFQIDLPPLRERREDIEPLARHFLKSLGAAADSSHSISPDAIRELQRRPWWGNVRELRNAIQHAMIVARGGTIQSEHLPPALPQFEGGFTPQQIQDTIAEQLMAWTEEQLSGGAEISNLYERLMQMVEPPVFRKVLELSQGQYVAAAKVLGLHRTTLKKKIDEYDSESGESRISEL
jgi:two-component system nitrogen regulation response regulator GlnG